MSLGSVVQSHLVLVGAGHAHLEVLRRLGRSPIPGARVTLVTRTRATAYSGMLPGVLAGHYRLEDMLIPVAPLAARAGAACILAEAVGLDPVGKRLRLSTGLELGYDVLSLDIGSTPDLSSAPAIGARLVPVKPLDAFMRSWEAAEASYLRSPGARVAVVGGGLAGAEIALALQHRLARTGRSAQIALVEQGPTLVPTMPGAVRRALGRALSAGGIELLVGTTVAREADVVVWTAGAAPASWLAATGLALDARGFVLVGADLQSRSHPGVFAGGDIASMAENPRPKAGVFAVRQGPVLHANLRRCLAGRPLRRFRPQRAWLSLIATGSRHAIATRNNVTVSGAWVWRWKDWTDRRFVARYREGGGPRSSARDDEPDTA